MTISIISADQIHLPDKIARKLRGKELEILETGEGILLKPIADSIREARGALRGSNFTLKNYLLNKKAEKDLEN